ncbi:MAG TPA: tetratricopeptide repeat protein [candidate division Zixibacteria bacterium]|nr:tetratricopeptide repeat protein [candidate division Zixibacteria bacterium]
MNLLIRNLIITTVIAILVVWLVGCRSDISEKLPITTTSDEALENYLKGRDYGERLRISEAQHYLNLALEEDPDFARAHLEITQVMQNSRRALEHIREAAALRDKVSPGERLLIDFFVAGSNNDVAGQYSALDKLVEMYPKDERVQELLGNYYYSQQEYRKAIDQFEKVHELAPSFSQAYNMEGYAERALGNFNKAEKALQRYIELIPDDPNPYDSYADLLMKMGQFDSSIVYYSRALEVDSSFSASYTGVASNLMLLGRYDDARAEASVLFDRSDMSAYKREALRMIAVTYIDQQNYTDAIKTLHQRYEITEETQDYPAQINDLFTIGTVLLESGQVTEAAKTFQEASRLSRRSDLSKPLQEGVERRYLFNMARVALARKDLATAQARFASYSEQIMARKVPAEIRTVHLLAGIIALYERDYDKAVKELSQTDRQSPYALFQMGLALQGRGELDNARKLFKEVSEYNQPGSLEYALVRERAMNLAVSLLVQ